MKAELNLSPCAIIHYNLENYMWKSRHISAIEAPICKWHTGMNLPYIGRWFLRLNCFDRTKPLSEVEKE
jgi:hypothetical protein